MDFGTIKLKGGQEIVVKGINICDIYVGELLEDRPTLRDSCRDRYMRLLPANLRAKDGLVLPAVWTVKKNIL